MSKIFSVILLSFIGIFSVQDNQVYVKSNLPGEMYPGGTYTVEITIHKKNLNHYAAFKQQFPKGFRVIERQSGAANFKFQNGKLEFTWLRLPESSPITLSYDIVADAGVKAGSYNFPAEFVYSYRNYRGAVSVANSKIIVYDKDAEFSSRKDLPKDPKTIQVLRFIPQYQPEKKALLVKLMISRGVVEGKAKITETIPPGYNAVVSDAKGAHFQVTKNNVEFIWNKLPKNNNFVISYLLSPHKATSPLPNITGIFRFLKNNQLMDVVIKQVDYRHINNQKPRNNEQKKEVIDYFGY